MPAWVVHGETGDGGVIDAERRVLEGYRSHDDHHSGPSFLTANEEPALVATLVTQALARLG